MQGEKLGQTLSYVGSERVKKNRKTEVGVQREREIGLERVSSWKKSG